MACGVNPKRGESDPSAHPERECRVILSYGELEASLGYMKLRLKNAVSEQNTKTTVPTNCLENCKWKKQKPQTEKQIEIINE